MNPHRFVLLAVLIVLGMIVSPACASVTGLPWPTALDQLDALLNAHTNLIEATTSFTYDAREQGDSIYKIKFNVPANSYVNFTLYYGTDGTVTGSASTVTEWDWSNPIPMTTSTVELNGETKSYTFWDTNPNLDVDLTGYGTDAGGNLSGIMVYSEGYGNIFGNDLAVGYEIANPLQNLIYKFEFTSVQPTNIEYSYANTGDLVLRYSAGSQQGLFDQVKAVVDFAMAMIGLVLSIAYQFLKWMKFFFIDNLLLTLALYIAVTMAFAARNNIGRPDKFIRQFVKDQIALFKGIAGLWQTLIDILSSFRGIFRI